MGLNPSSDPTPFNTEHETTVYAYVCTITVKILATLMYVGLWGSFANCQYVPKLRNRTHFKTSSSLPSKFIQENVFSDIFVA